MWYIIGQVLVCLLLTALLGVLAGWLIRGYQARAELATMQRQLQRQARDLRSRASSAPSTDTGANRDAEGRAQQQLRHQLVRLQAQVEQREKEIAALRRVIGDQRTASDGGSTRAPASSPKAQRDAPPQDADPQRKPG